MSPQPQRISTPSRDFTKIPNAIIEFQNGFTPAELRLVLMVFMWPGSAISDKTWTTWTGLKARAKEMAIKGLLEKGLTTAGKGDKMTFAFDLERWKSWRPPGDDKPRTAGRAESVPAKPGQQIHPECRDNGCGRLCESGSTPFLVTNIAQPVARINTPHEVEEQAKQANEKLFQRFIGSYLSVGVPLNEADIGKCSALWNKLNPSEQTTATAYCLARADNEWFRISQPRFIPRPWTVLGEKHWTRSTSPPGTVSYKKLTDHQRREVVMAKKVLDNPTEFAEDAIQHARDIVAKYEG